MLFPNILLLGIQYRNRILVKMLSVPACIIFLWSQRRMINTVNQECLDKMIGCFSSIERSPNSNLLLKRIIPISSLNETKLNMSEFFATELPFLRNSNCSL